MIKRYEIGVATLKRIVVIHQGGLRLSAYPMKEQQIAISIPENLKGCYLTYPFLSFVEYFIYLTQNPNMNTLAPIIVIDDDEDDRSLLQEAFNNLHYTNELLFFPDGHKALEFLHNSEITPFLILSDVNMPKLNGFELRDKIKTDIRLHQKCIPYLFFSTAVNKESVIKAYNLSVHGFFQKGNSLKALEKTLKVIMEYWTECAAPNKFHNQGGRQ